MRATTLSTTKKSSKKTAKKTEKKVVEPKFTKAQQAMLSERSKKYDANATKMDCIDDLRRVQQEHPDMFITRNFYRIHGKYSEKTWNRFAGTMEEFRSQAKLQLSRSQRQLEKHIAKHASLDESRAFFRLEVEPWIDKHVKSYPSKNGMKKVIVASDFHDIDVDLFCLSVFIDTCRVEQPDVIGVNGDAFDLYEFSSFSHDPRRTRLKDRMEFVRDFIFKPLRQACPNAQIDLIVGNHEHRILKHMAAKTENMAALMELMDITLAQILGLDEFEINLVSKGNTTAFQAKEIKEEMAKNFKLYFNCLVLNHTGYESFGVSTISGHTHRPEMTSEVNLRMGPVNKLTTGCMCKLDADYTNTKTNWQNSFAIAYVDTIHERVQLNHVMFTEPFVNVNGRYYFRDYESTEMRDSAEAIAKIKAAEIKGFVNHDEGTAIVAGLEKSKKAQAI
jgi:predicted phosphodiesterase